MFLRRGLFFSIAIIFYCTCSFVSEGNADDTFDIYSNELSNDPYILSLFDKDFPNKIDSADKNTIVIYGDYINLADKNISPIGAPNQRRQDIIIIGRVVKLGPNLSVDLQGAAAEELWQVLRGGDLYIVADQVIINGLDNNLIVTPVEVRSNGGLNSLEASRDGRVLIFSNDIKLDEHYLYAKVNQLNLAANGDKIPLQILKIISRNFSPENSIHQAINNNNAILWSGLGDAYSRWINEESDKSIAVRELNLSLVSSHPLGNADVVASYSSAVNYIHSDILSGWFVAYLKRAEAKARISLAQRDFSSAAQVYHLAKPFFGIAPNEALTSSSYLSSISSLQDVYETLSKQNITETIQLSVPDGPPIQATIIRDLAYEKIAVIPNIFLLNPVIYKNELMVGFAEHDQDVVKVSLRGKVAVDKSLLDLVQMHFSEMGGNVVSAGDSIIYEGVDFGAFGDTQFTVSNLSAEGRLEIDMVVPGDQFVKTMLILGQQGGIVADVTWRHKFLDLPVQSSPIVLSFQKLDIDIAPSTGFISNPYSRDIEINYFLDGMDVSHEGFPVFIGQNQKFEINCKEPICYVPASAIYVSFDKSDPMEWFVPLSSSSVIRRYFVENRIGDDEMRGGDFHSISLEIKLLSSAGTSAQSSGLFNLGYVGSRDSKKSFSFLESPNSVSSVEVSGRVFWGDGQSYHDIKKVIKGSSVIIVDSSWLKN